MSKIFRGHVSEIALYKGMNRGKSGTNWLNFNKHGFHYTLSIPVKKYRTKDDHRKMIFFNNNANETEAILIGSSNFSEKTYFGTDKGEADILLFYNEKFCQFCRGAILDNERYFNCVLSESIAMPRGATPQSYLTSIYDEFRRNAR